MAETRTPASLRAWAKASPEELAPMEAEDDLYNANLAEEEVSDPRDFDDEGLPPDVEAPDFDPEELESYAYELADQLTEGEGDDDLIALVDDYDPTEGTPRWVDDDELWTGAIDLSSEVVEDSDPIFWQLVAHLYDYMGGAILEPEANPPEMPSPEEFA